MNWRRFNRSNCIARLEPGIPLAKISDWRGKSAGAEMILQPVHAAAPSRSARLVPGKLLHSCGLTVARTRPILRMSPGTVGPGRLARGYISDFYMGCRTFEEEAEL